MPDSQDEALYKCHWLWLEVKILGQRSPPPPPATPKRSHTPHGHILAATNPRDAVGHPSISSRIDGCFGTISHAHLLPVPLQALPAEQGDFQQLMEEYRRFEEFREIREWQEFMQFRRWKELRSGCREPLETHDSVSGASAPMSTQPEILQTDFAVTGEGGGFHIGGYGDDPPDPEPLSGSPFPLDAWGEDSGVFSSDASLLADPAYQPLSGYKQWLKDQRPSTAPSRRPRSQPHHRRQQPPAMPPQSQPDLAHSPVRQQPLPPPLSQQQQRHLPPRPQAPVASHRGPKSLDPQHQLEQLVRPRLSQAHALPCPDVR